MKRYLVYWYDVSKGISGNSILELNPKKVEMVEIIIYLVDSINKKDSDVNIKNLVVKFMMELK